MAKLAESLVAKLRPSWRDPMLRAWTAFNEDHLSIVAAGVAFHILLALLPAMAAFVAIYGLVGRVAELPQQLHMLSIILPTDVVKAIGEEMTRIAQARTGGLSLAATLGAAVAFWSANGAMRAMFSGLNIAQETREERGFLLLNTVSVAFTAGLLVFLTFVVAVFGAGAVIGAVLGRPAMVMFDFIRWPLLVVAFGAGLSLLYRFGPSGGAARRRWFQWGTALATAGWLAASALFSNLLGHFTHYDRTYGSLGAAIGLMMWLWLSAVIILAGAEINSELERRFRSAAPSRPAARGETDPAGPTCR
ncbi:MAG TPA: YihY/virulence factor BrkB family protein [Caulobacteraceae bacterium]